MINTLSNIGANHYNSGGENQDVIYYQENDQFRVITLADGVSSCAQAKTGAKIASQEITILLLNEGTYFLEYEPENSVDIILSNVLYALKSVANENSTNLSDYSSTLSSVLLDKRSKKLMFFHLGDGIIMATDDSRCCVLAKPFDSSEGCCVTTTEKAENIAQIKVMDADILKSIVICSDGAWNLMYDRGKLKQEVAEYLIKNDLDDLKTFMKCQECRDDYSFISMNIQ